MERKVALQILALGTLAIAASFANAQTTWTKTNSYEIATNHYVTIGTYANPEDYPGQWAHSEGEARIYGWVRGSVNGADYPTWTAPYATLYEPSDSRSLVLHWSYRSGILPAETAGTTRWDYTKTDGQEGWAKNSTTVTRQRLAHESVGGPYEIFSW